MTRRDSSRAGGTAEAGLGGVADWANDVSRWHAALPASTGGAQQSAHSRAYALGELLSAGTPLAETQHRHRIEEIDLGGEELLYLDPSASELVFLAQQKIPGLSASEVSSLGLLRLSHDGEPSQTCPRGGLPRPVRSGVDLSGVSWPAPELEWGDHPELDVLRIEAGEVLPAPGLRPLTTAGAGLLLGVEDDPIDMSPLLIEPLPEEMSQLDWPRLVRRAVEKQEHSKATDQKPAHKLSVCASQALQRQAREADRSLVAAELQWFAGQVALDSGFVEHGVALCAEAYSHGPVYLPAVVSAIGTARSTADFPRLAETYRCLVSLLGDAHYEASSEVIDLVHFGQSAQPAAIEAADVGCAMRTMGGLLALSGNLLPGSSSLTELSQREICERLNGLTRDRALGAALRADLARTLEQQGLLGQAVRVFREIASEGYPLGLEGWLRCAHALADPNSVQEALAQSAANGSTLRPIRLRRAALIADLRGNDPKAALVLLEAADADCDSVHIKQDLADTLSRTGCHFEAAEAYRQLAALAKDANLRGQALVDSGLSFELAGERERALGAYRRSLRLAPGEAARRAHTALLLSDADPRRRLEAHRDLADRRTGSARAAHLYACALIHENELAERTKALTVLQQALASDPASTIVLDRLARLAEEDGIALPWGDIYESAARAARSADLAADYRCRAAQSYQRNGQPDEALAIYRAVTAEVPSRWDAEIHLRYLLAKSGRSAELAARIEEDATNDSQISAALWAHAGALHLHAVSGSAERCFRNALAADASYLPALFGLSLGLDSDKKIAQVDELWRVFADKLESATPQRQDLLLRRWSMLVATGSDASTQQSAYAAVANAGTNNWVNSNWPDFLAHAVDEDLIHDWALGLKEGATDFEAGAMTLVAERLRRRGNNATAIRSTYEAALRSECRPLAAVSLVLVQADRGDWRRVKALMSQEPVRPSAGASYTLTIERQMELDFLTDSTAALNLSRRLLDAAENDLGRLDEAPSGRLGWHDAAAWLHDFLARPLSDIAPGRILPVAAGLDGAEKAATWLEIGRRMLSHAGPAGGGATELGELRTLTRRALENAVQADSRGLLACHRLIDLALDEPNPRRLADSLAALVHRVPEAPLRTALWLWSTNSDGRVGKLVHTLDLRNLAACYRLQRLGRELADWSTACAGFEAEALASQVEEHAAQAATCAGYLAEHRLDDVERAASWYRFAMRIGAPCDKAGFWLYSDLLRRRGEFETLREILQSRIEGLDRSDVKERRRLAELLAVTEQASPGKPLDSETGAPPAASGGGQSEVFLQQSEQGDRGLEPAQDARTSQSVQVEQAPDQPSTVDASPHNSGSDDFGPGDTQTLTSSGRWVAVGRPDLARGGRQQQKTSLLPLRGALLGQSVPRDRIVGRLPVDLELEVVRGLDRSRAERSDVMQAYARLVRKHPTQVEVFGAMCAFLDRIGDQETERAQLGECLANLRARLLRDPYHVDCYRVLRQLFRRQGDPEAEGIVCSALRALGIGPREDESVRAASPSAPCEPLLRLPPATLDRLTGLDEVPTNIRQLLQGLGHVLIRVTSSWGKCADLRSKRRLDSDHRAVKIVESMLPSGSSPIVMQRATDPACGFFVDWRRGVTVAIGTQTLKSTPPRRLRFQLARLVWAVQRSMLLPLRLGAEKLSRLIAAVIRLYVPGHGPPEGSDPEFEQLCRQLRRLVRQPPQGLMPHARAYAHTKLDGARLTRMIVRAANRFALCDGGGDLQTALSTIAESQPLSLHRCTESQEHDYADTDIGDLLRYAVSENCIELCRAARRGLQTPRRQTVVSRTTCSASDSP